MYSLAVTQANKMLGNTLSFMQEAEAFAAAKKFDEIVFFQDRLAANSILRMRGVDVGKWDFIGNLNLKER